MEQTGLLEKLIFIKQTENLTSFNISLLKISSDQLISDYTDNLLKALLQIDNVKPNIGINKYFLFKDNYQLNIYDVNYLLSKKFKQNKVEAIVNSNIFLILINIHDTRGINNIKSLIDEIKAIHGNSNLSKVKIYAVMINQSNNFILNLIKENQIEYIKNTYLFNGYIEVDYDNISIDDILNKII